MGDNRISVGERMGHEIIICDLEEGIHGRRLIALADGPRADPAERGQNRGVRLDEETGAASHGPSGEFIGAGLDLVTDLLDTETRPAPLCAMSQSQNAGQKSRP